MKVFKFLKIEKNPMLYDQINIKIINHQMIHCYHYRMISKKITKQLLPTIVKLFELLRETGAFLFA